MKTEEAVLKITAANHAPQLVQRETGDWGLGKASSLCERFEVLRNEAYRIVGLGLTRAVRPGLDSCHPTLACQIRAVAPLNDIERYSAG